MAEISELESALKKADAAGNAEDAKRLANEIVRLRGNGSQREKPETPSYLGGLVHELIGAAKGAVGLIPGGQGVTELIDYARTGKEPTETHFPVAGPYGATSAQVRQVEQQTKPSMEAMSAIAQHPQLAATAITSALQKEWATLISGGGYTPEQQERWGEAAVNAGFMTKALYEAGKAAGYKMTDILTKKEIEKILDAQKKGNTEEVNKILGSKTEQLKTESESLRRAETTKSQAILDRINAHREKSAQREIAHNKSQADLDRQIAEAQKNLNDRKVRELNAIKDSEVQSRTKAIQKERLKIKELADEHERVKANAQREYQDALAAQSALADAERLGLTSTQRSVLRRRIDVYNRRIASSEAGQSVSFPPAEGLISTGAESEPLSTRLVSAIEGRIDVENAKIDRSPIYQTFFNRVKELANEGKIWGRDEKSGAKLIDTIKERLHVSAEAKEDDFSYYIRQQYAKLLKYLEHDPAKVISEGPKGGRIAEQPPGVPVSAGEAINVVKDLRDQSFVLRQNGNPRWSELRDLADTVENSLRNFVGEEFMPRKQWADLNRYRNELLQTDAGRIASARKGGDYLDISRQDRQVPIENVEQEIFKNSTNINGLRRLLRNDDEFLSMLDQHLSNTLSGKTAKEVRTWMGDQGRWIDHVDDPSLRPRLERYAAELEAYEGNATQAANSIKVIEEKLNTAQETLSKDLQTISERQQEFVEESAKWRQQRVSESAKETQRAERETAAAGKRQRLDIKRESEQQRQKLAEALSPDVARLSELREARREKAGTAKISAAESATEKQRLLREKLEVKQQVAKSKAERATKERIARNLETIMFSGSAQNARVKFIKLRPELINSGLMSETEAANIMTMLDEDVKNVRYGQAKLKAKAAVRKWAGKVVGVGLTAAGLGFAEHEYLTIPITKGSEAYR